MRTRRLDRMFFGRRTYLKAGLLSGAFLVGLSTAAGCGWGERPRHHWGGSAHHGWDEDPAAAKEHAREAAQWLMARVDATEAQQTKVDGIVNSLIDDVLPLAEQHRGNRNQMIAALTSESIDRAALSRLRDADLELASQAYARFANAFADIAEVLTPEQRIELAQAARRFRRWH